MADLITVDRSDGRIIAGLVTSLVFHWHRVPIGLQTAIISHASEAGFGHCDLAPQADRRIVSFIVTHHKALRDHASEGSWNLRHWLSFWLRKRRLLADVDRERHDQAMVAATWSWAEREARRHTVSSEIARGYARIRQAIAGLNAGSG